jgi:hypothetical protein
MAFEVQQSGYGVVIVKLTGELKKSDLDQLHSTARAAIKEWGTIRILAKLEDFRGWEKSPQWGDVTFINEEGRKIEKMAIVGDEAWRDMALAFTAQGFRATAIEYFLPRDHDLALSWLGA